RVREAPMITSASSSLRGSFNRRNPAPIQPPYRRRAGKTMNASNGRVGSFGMNPIVSCLNRIVRENTDSRFFNWVIQRSSVVERSAVNVFERYFLREIATKAPERMRPESDRIQMNRQIG